jgi:hypothetical protein
MAIHTVNPAAGHCAAFRELQDKTGITRLRPANSRAVFYKGKAKLPKKSPHFSIK